MKRYVVLSRYKHDPSAPWELFAECLKEDDARFIAQSCERHSDQVFRVEVKG